jgi:hypothetical protein
MSGVTGAFNTSRCCFDVVFNSTGTAICVFINNTGFPVGQPYVTTCSPPYTSWSSPTVLPLSLFGGFFYPAGAYWVELAADRYKEHVYAVTLSTNFTGNDTYGWKMTSAGWGPAILLSNNANTTETGAIDVEVEATTGDAVCVWSEKSGTPNGLPYYSTNVGGSWSLKSVVPQTGTVAKDTTYIRMASNTTAGSNGIAMAALNEVYTLNANIWTGSGWSGYSTLTNIAYTNETGCFDVAYENASGRPVCAWSEGVFSLGQPFYSTYSGSWSTKQVFQGSMNVDVEWIRMDANLSAGSDQIFCAVLSKDQSITAYIWNGNVWSSASGNPLTTTAYSSNTGCVDIAWTKIPELSFTIVIPMMTLIILSQLVRKRRKKNCVDPKEVGP